jgi:hypothetical protein
VLQSVSAELRQDNFSGERSDYRRAQANWRLATQLGGGELRADLDLLGLRQRPNSPAPIDEETGAFSTLLPVDFNQNPANAILNTDRYKVVLEYDKPLSFGRWGARRGPVLSDARPPHQRDPDLALQVVRLVGHTVGGAQAMSDAGLSLKLTWTSLREYCGGSE